MLKGEQASGAGVCEKVESVAGEERGRLTR